MTVKIPKWSFLRSIGNSIVIRLTILIPLIGYLIIFNENIVKYLELAKEFSGISTPPQSATVSPRLLLIYFGLCALALGSTIFGIYCPNEVKHYGTAAAYAGGDGKNIGDFAFGPIESTLENAIGYSSEYQGLIESYNRHRELDADYSLEDRRKDVAEAKSQVHNGLLHLYFDYLDNGHPIWRLGTAVSFIIGFIALAIPSLQVFWRVARIMFSLIKSFALAYF